MADIPEIPSDAKTAASHPPPIDLNNPPLPDPKETGTNNYDTPDDRPVDNYDSPEPIEAMFMQMRDDMKRNEKLLLLTTTTVIFMGLLFAYYIRKGGLDGGFAE